MNILPYELLVDVFHHLKEKRIPYDVTKFMKIIKLFLKCNTEIIFHGQYYEYINLRHLNVIGADLRLDFVKSNTQVNMEYLESDKLLYLKLNTNRSQISHSGQIHKLVPNLKYLNTNFNMNNNYPKNLKILTMKNDCIIQNTVINLKLQIKDNVRLPSYLKYLNTGLTTKLDFMRQTIVTLIINKSYQSEINIWPCGLKKLKINNKYEYIIRNLPDTISKLILSNEFKGQVTDWPKQLTHLIVNKRVFLQTKTPIKLIFFGINGIDDSGALLRYYPENVIQMVLKTNVRVYCQIPLSVTKLTISEDYVMNNKILNLHQLKLTHLIICDTGYYENNLSMINSMTTLTHLSIIISCDIPQLPINLTHLKCNNFDQTHVYHITCLDETKLIYLDIMKTRLLPATLKNLKVGYYYNATLPESLEKLWIRIEHHVLYLPQRLTHFVYTETFGTEIPKLPDSLIYVKILHEYYSHIPKSVKFAVLIGKI